MINVQALFEKHADRDIFEFDQVENRRSACRDIHAMLLLQEICPTDGGMIAAAGHDQIWFEVDVEAFAAKAAEYHIIELSRCGVFYDEQTDSLSMFC